MVAYLFSHWLRVCKPTNILKGISEDLRAIREVFLKKEHVDTAHDKIAALNNIAQECGQLLVHMALVWILRDIQITSALIGASSVKQIDDDVEMLKTVVFRKWNLR